MERIEDKLRELEQFLTELSSVLPNSLDEYKNDFKIRDICERHAEKIIAAIIDAAFLIIKSKKLNMPESEKKVFVVLAEKDIISSELSSKLQNAKGMRNVIAHEYGKIDNKIVFEAVTEQLIPDAEEFVKSIKNYLRKK